MEEMGKEKCGTIREENKKKENKKYEVGIYTSRVV